MNALCQHHPRILVCGQKACDEVDPDAGVLQAREGAGVLDGEVPAAPPIAHVVAARAVREGALADVAGGHQ